MNEIRPQMKAIVDTMDTEQKAKYEKKAAKKVEA